MGVKLLKVRRFLKKDGKISGKKSEVVTSSIKSKKKKVSFLEIIVLI